MTNPNLQTQAQARAERIATMAAKELIWSEFKACDEEATYSIASCQIDGHMRDCIDHLCHHGQAVERHTSDGYVLVQFGDYTLEGLA